MGSYFGEFTQTHQGEPGGDRRVPPAPHNVIAPTWGHLPRAGPSSGGLGHTFSVFKHPRHHELGSTTFFNSGATAAGDSGGGGATAAQSRNQISSPRDAGFKKRKNQTKKVVCVPAPDAAGGKPGGEIVPSDSWSWRKYGQKPIKGSPYPRGYYRCSSSKGCSARKQVERSKTDPSMLMVTYTCEHNHPLPTQKSSSPVRKVVSPGSAGAPAAAKSESPEATEALHQIGQTMPPELSWTEDFFAELGELGEDSMSLVFSKEFVDSKLIGEGEEEDAMDVFRRFDWVKHSFGESK